MANILLDKQAYESMRTKIKVLSYGVVILTLIAITFIVAWYQQNAWINGLK